MFKITIFLVLVTTAYSLPSVFNKPHQYSQTDVEHHQHVDPYKYHHEQSSGRNYHHQQPERQEVYRDQDKPTQYVDSQKYPEDVSARHHVDQPKDHGYHHEHQPMLVPHKDVAARHYVNDHDQPKDGVYHQENQPEDDIPSKDVSARHQTEVSDYQKDNVYYQEHQTMDVPYKSVAAKHHVDEHGVHHPAYPEKSVDQKSYVHHGVDSHPLHQSPVQPKSYVHHSTVGQHHVESKAQVYPKQHQSIEHVPKSVDHHVGVEPKQASVENPVASARIVQQEAEVNPDGSFSNVWNSDNGIRVQEQGEVRRVGESNVAVVKGQYSYFDDEGHEYHVQYTADENGFHVQGDHLPTPPPIPLAIARGLEYSAKHPYVETTTYNSQDEYQQRESSS